MNLWDWIGIFAIFLIVISGGYIAYWNIVYKISECGSNPVLFAAHELVQDEYNFTYIVLNVYGDVNQLVPLDSFKFNYGDPPKRSENPMWTKYKDVNFTKYFVANTTINSS